MKPINVAGHRIYPGHPCFVIAEAGVNHNGDVHLAKRLIDVAVEAGADAVKFQTFKAEQVVSVAADKATYQKQHTPTDESQLEMISTLELSREATAALAEHCNRRSILFLSTPFDEESVDLLEEIGVPAFKIASGEITNWRLLEHIGAKKKPVLLSTGMSYLSEVDEAVRVLRDAGCSDLALLHCTSNYPAEADTVNLRAMRTMALAFDVPVGLSDHTLGIEIALAAASLGACIIEKHFTLDKTLPGPDHHMSLDPGELKTLLRGIRIVEAALGSGVKQPTVAEKNVRDVARRSIVAREEIPAGTRLSPDMLVFKRPGSGIPPSMLRCVVGRTAARTLRADAIITEEDLA